MSDAGARAELAGLTAGARNDSALWQEIRTVGREFQQGLLALLFETPLRSISSEYTVPLTGPQTVARPSPLGLANARPPSSRA